MKETLESAHGAEGSPDIDVVYDALRVELVASRDRLGISLDAIGSESHVPLSGEDPLKSLPPDVDVRPANAKRAEVDVEGARLRQLETDLRIDRARADYDEVETLNRDRLALYASLSPDKREAITGFGPAGADQARSEARQVSLVLRYHFSATLRWFRALRTSSDGRGQSALAATFIALKWLLPVGLFLAWRRRAKTALARWQQHLKTERLKEGRVGRTPLERVLAFFIRVRISLEWLILVATALWLLPVEATGLLEVALIRTILLWALGGAFVVTAIDALADESPSRARASRLQSAHIRLRSLRLIGWVVVAVGLLLSLSDRLVGKGTIYSWVFSTCWFMALPIALLLVRWWRPIIFDRVELKRRKTAFDRWVLSSKTGLQSLVTATAGGAVLFAVGAFRAGRTWISTFELTRRFLAYLFRRDITKRADELSKLELVRLSDEVHNGLGPSVSTGEIVPSVADEQVDEIIRRISDAGGGVFAIVGERGAGKTRILDRIRASCDDITYCQCPFGGQEALSAELAERFDVPKESALADIACMFDTARRDSGFLIDDAHRLVIPMMGGMKSFDGVLEVARRMSSHCSWVFAFDEVVWRFIVRARGALPLFDEVIHLSAWREEGIARLLQSRSKALKISPAFDHLVQDLPKDADDIDLQEAIDRTAANYYRLIWDYSAGNPGVALHTWRRCLGVAPDGSIAVRGFRAPEVEELEELPDSAVFVLRAVVQLEQALMDDICSATLLSKPEVKNAISHGVLRGYFLDVGGRYAVTWAWYRPITRFLQRRHLLVLGS